MQVKQHVEESGTGGDWAVRLSASQVAGASKRKHISLIMYLGDEGERGWTVMPDGEVGGWVGGSMRLIGTLMAWDIFNRHD
jgi:hypothetical protein